MNIDIENDVPLPDDGWVNEPPAEFIKAASKLAKAGISPYDPIDYDAKVVTCGTCGGVVEPDWMTGTRCKCSPAFNPPTAGPNDCTFIGGPLNGKFGPIKGNAKVVEIELYNTDGSVSSVELYSLGDNPTPTFRYYVGSKQP